MRYEYPTKYLFMQKYVMVYYFFALHILMKFKTKALILSGKRKFKWKNLKKKTSIGFFIFFLLQ